MSSLRIDDFCQRDALYIQNGFACGEWNDTGKGMLHLRPFNVTDNGQIDLSTAKYVDAKRDLSPYLIRQGDVIFNNTNSEELVGKTALWGKDQQAVLSNHMTIVRVLKPDLLSPQFLAFYLLKKWFDGYMHQACRRHVNQASVSIERLKDTPFPDFDIDEQRRIACVLSTVQTAIEQQARLIALTQELKKALMRKLFTEGLRGEKQKMTEIGPVPESWQVLPLGEVMDGTPKNGMYKPLEAYGAGTLILRINDFSNDGDIVTSASNRISADKSEISTYGLREDDIVTNRVNSLSHLGKTALVGALAEPMLFESNMMKYRVDRSKALPSYVMRLINSPIGKDQIVARAKRAVAQSSINQGSLKAVLLPIPEVEVQEEVVAIVDTLIEKVEVHNRKKGVLEDLFRTLLHQLMTAHIRVNNPEFDFLEG